MSHANIQLNKNIAFEIKDDTGVVPGNPIEFIDQQLEETVYFTGETTEIELYTYLNNNPLPYGTPTYAISGITGTSLSKFNVGSYSDKREIFVNAIVQGYGDTTATLTITVGSYTDSIPIIFHVPEVSLPTSLDTPTVFTASVNEEIAVPRPGLIPANTDFSPSDFVFDVGVYFDGWQDYPGYTSGDGSVHFIEFNEPGYYKADIEMQLNNIFLRKPIVFEITDDTGVVPGGPFTFSESSIESTLYMSDTNTHVGHINLSKMLPGLGGGIWLVKKLSPDAPNLRSSLWVSDDRMEESFNLSVPEESKLIGTFKYELNCELNGKTTVIPITLTITDKTPASVSLAQTVFTFKVDEWYLLPRPDFNPGDTGIDGSTLNMSVYGSENFWDNVTIQNGNRVRLSTPGYYNVSIYLEGDDFGYGVDALLIVNNADNTPPAGSPLEFAADTATVNVYTQNGMESYRHFSFKEDTSSLGALQTTLTHLSGSAVEAEISANWISSYGVRLDFKALQTSGTSTFRLTSTAGGYSDSMLITVTVNNATLPTSMVTEALAYTITTNDSLVLPRPVLLPANTQITEGQFNYTIFFESGTPVTFAEDSEAKKIIRFSEPGYYTGSVYMEYDNVYFYHDITFTVSEPGSPPPPPVLIKEIAFSQTNYILEIGQTISLRAFTQPINPSNPLLKWTVNDETVVEKDENNLFTALRPGTVTVTASAQDGSGVSATCTITVPSVTYDMSQVAWTTTTVFNFDGTEKKVELTGLPAGVTATYTGNTATEIGTYTASVELTYENPAFVGPTFEDLPWEITGPVVPTRAKPKITKVEAVSASALKLTWGRVAGASGYNVYVSARPNDSYTLLKSTTALSLSITRLKAGTRYFYKVEAYDLIGGIQYVSSPMSSWAAGVPLARPAITSISSPSARRITLTWNKSAGAGGWQVMFAPSAKGPWKVVRTIFVTNASFAGHKSGSTFYFKIRPYKKYYAYAYFGPESPVRYVKVK